MGVQISEPALAAGFGNEPIAGHTARTMMLAELRLLLAACPAGAAPDEYRAAVVAENVLLKPTETTRVKSFLMLRALYALDRRVLLFRALRDLWDDDGAAQPLLAVLAAVARDPILRATVALLLAVPQGTTVLPQTLADAVREGLPGRYNPTTLEAIGWHAASTWQQAGHLEGRLNKRRSQSASRPAALAYALLLGHLCGDRGEALFHTLWAQILDAPEHLLRAQAVAAARQGWIDYRQAGNVTEISFRYLLRPDGEGNADE